MRYTIYEGVKRTRSKVKKLVAGLAALVVPAAMLMSGGANAAPGYTLFGDAAIVPGGNPGNAAQIRSDADPGYGGVEYDVAAGITFADLTTLSTDFFVEADDLCAGGSPRFQIRVPETGPLEAGDPTGDNIFIYFGTDSGSDPCVPGTWQNTGDLLEAGALLDTTQVGGTFYDTYANALTTYGTLAVSGVTAVVDSNWAHVDNEQTVLLDNTNIDGIIYTYEPEPTKDSCKKGGWQTLTDGNGNTFKNQGDCVSFFATKGRNAGSGN